MPRKMLRDFVATTSITTTGMSITRLTGFESASIAPALVCAADAAQDGKEHQRDAARHDGILKARFHTTAHIGWTPVAELRVEALAMVVSEMGARLSPKMAPETMAPARNMGLPPRMMPAG